MSQRLRGVPLGFVVSQIIRHTDSGSSTLCISGSYITERTTSASSLMLSSFPLPILMKSPLSCCISYWQFFIKNSILYITILYHFHFSLCHSWKDWIANYFLWIFYATSSVIKEHSYTRRHGSIFLNTEQIQKNSILYQVNR